MNKRKLLYLFLSAVVAAVMTGGCLRQPIPSQYDLKLKTNVKELACEQGGSLEEVEITVDSRRYQELNSDTNIFLSYHILDSEGTLLVQDGIRTRLSPVAARGVEKEIVEIKTPLEKGNYVVELDLVEEGATWFSTQGMETLRISLSVRNTTVPDYSAITLASDMAALEYSTDPTSHLPLTVTVDNSSGTALCNSGTEAVFLSYLIKDSSGNLVAEGERIPLPETISTGTTMEVPFIPQKELFSVPGSYIIELDLLMEHVSWFKEMGVTPLEVFITVTD